MAPGCVGQVCGVEGVVAADSKGRGNSKARPAAGRRSAAQQLSTHHSALVDQQVVELKRIDGRHGSRLRRTGVRCRGCGDCRRQEQREQQQARLPQAVAAQQLY